MPELGVNQPVPTSDLIEENKADFYFNFYAFARKSHPVLFFRETVDQRAVGSMESNDGVGWMALLGASHQWVQTSS